MTEAEWLACNDPRPMLEFLGRKTSRRKLRLFASGCARRVAHHLADPRSHCALDVAERYADRGKRGPPTRNQLQKAELEAYAVARSLNGTPNFWLWNAAQAATEVASFSAFRAAEGAAAQAAFSFGRREAEERAVQASLLRCVFGSPFRPCRFDDVTRTAAITSLAEAVYAERELPSCHLDSSRLAVLSDALEETGCTDADILSHLRSPVLHVRGCWPLDLILGKS
jgi:hypothetical protein